MAIEISKNNHIGTLTINRPDSLNAMNREVLIEFINGLKKIQSDNNISYKRDEVMASCGAKQAIINLMLASIHNNS